jgi:L-malate glycosyltransferase
MIVFVHLLNDNSGSPRVLTAVIKAIGTSEDRLMLGSDGDGPLGRCEVSVTRYWYRRGSNRIATLFTFAFSQIALYRALNRADIPQDATLYINTLLPFGAALWAKQKGRRVIYHLHEVSVSPASLRNFLIFIARYTAKQLIYVSQDHRVRLPIPGILATTLPNPVMPAIAKKAEEHRYTPRASGQFEVLMLSSARDFKGVPEFIALCARFMNSTDLSFVLVLNGDDSEVEKYLSKFTVCANLTVHSHSATPENFYTSADILLNLSRPDEWIETFGLTLIEAMTFGVPVIAPPVGGPTEIVRDGIDGFLINGSDTEALDGAITSLAGNPDLALKMSQAAESRAADYCWDNFVTSLTRITAP